jgi:hypothetical protein
MKFKKCSFKRAEKADRYVRGQLSFFERLIYEYQLKQSTALRKEVRFARQLMLYYQKLESTLKEEDS